MVPEIDRPTVNAMRIWGGSFVQALAAAAERADRSNYFKLKETFPEYWEDYRKIAKSFCQSLYPETAQPESKDHALL